jgi:hypothetical protein
MMRQGEAAGFLAGAAVSLVVFGTVDSAAKLGPTVTRLANANAAMVVGFIGLTSLV